MAPPNLNSSNPLGTLKPGEQSITEKIIRRRVRGDTAKRLAILEKVAEDETGSDALQILRNAGVEAKDIVNGLALLGWNVSKTALSAAFNPIDTAESIASGKALESLKGTISTVGSAIADDYSHRYSPLFRGEFKEFAKGMKDKPLSFLLDLGGAMSLAGGTLKAAAIPLAESAAEAGLVRTGAYLSKAGQVLDPLYLVKSSAIKVGDKLPNLPLIGKNPRTIRGINKLTREGHTIPVEKGKRRSWKRQAEAMDALASLTPNEKARISLLLHGIDDGGEVSDTLRKATEYTRQIMNDPENLDLLGVVSEESRRRSIAPLIQKKFFDGELTFSDSTRQLLTDSGIIRSADPTPETLQILAKGGIAPLVNEELFFPGGLMDAPAVLFKEAEDQLTAAEKAVSYFPMVKAEAKMNPDLFIYRTGPSFTRMTPSASKHYTGDVMNQWLRSRNPDVFADTTLVLRQHINDLEMAKTLREIDVKMENIVDPRTGERVLQDVYLGKLPNNLLAFPSDGKAAAKVIKAMRKPLYGTADEITGKALNMKYGDLVKNVQASNKRGKYVMPEAKAREIADRTITEALKQTEYDGFIINNGDHAGRYRFVNPNQNPIKPLLPGNVLYAPDGLLRFISTQKKLGEATLNNLDAGSHFEAAASRAVRNIDGVSDDILGAIEKEVSDAARTGIDLLNTEFLDGATLKGFNKSLRNYLGKTLEGFGIDERSIKKAMEAYNQSVGKPGGRGGVSVARQMWVKQLPKHVADEIQSLYKPLFAGGNLNTAVRLFWDTPTAVWRAGVLNFTPRWHVNNLAGNMFLNVVAGVINPIDYMRALPFLGYRLANRFPRAIGMPFDKIVKALKIDTKKLAAVDEVLANSVNMGTFFKMENYPIWLDEAAETPIAKLQAKIINSKAGDFMGRLSAASGDLNTIFDQFFRDANMFSLVRGQIRKQSKGVLNKLTKSLYESKDAIYDYVTHAGESEVQSLAKKVNQWLPNYLTLLTPVERKLFRRVAPFYSWYRHMIGVGLMMPLNHPVRANVIANLSKASKGIEDDEWRANGIDPKNVKLVEKYLEGSKLLATKDGQARFLSLHGANPFHSILEIKDVGSKLHPAVKFAIESIVHKDLFTGRDFAKAIEIGPDGVLRERYDNRIFERLTNELPNAEAMRRIINPEQTDISGEVVFRRDRVLEALKFMGINIKERDIKELEDKAKKKEAELASRALNILLKKNRKNPEFMDKLLDILSRRREN